MLPDLLVNGIGECSFRCWRKGGTISKVRVLGLRSDANTMCIRVYEDNDGVVELTRNPDSSSRIEHIDVQYHFIRDIRR